jgi:peptidoglycan hydrolase-like protein with peptidoglycan-binding domain
MRAAGIDNTEMSGPATSGRAGPQALLFVVTAIAVLISGCSSAPLGTQGSVSRAPSTTEPATTLPPARPMSTTPSSTTTTAPSSTTTTTVAKKPPQPKPTYLSLGSSGQAVLALQERLSSLGYWLGPDDGVFGDSTQQAVYALQKAAGISRDGIVGPITDAALDRDVVPQPQSAPGYLIEVDLQDDLLMFVDNGKLEYVLNTSTGGGYTYTDDGETAIADTPVGTFQIYRQVNGMVVDSLGELWRPKFFSGGFAIHGDSYVPPYPVSHGCVRVSDEAIDWIWAENLAPIGTEVWVYRT